MDGATVEYRLWASYGFEPAIAFMIADKSRIDLEMRIRVTI